jgi:hypothetical protein
MPSFALPVTHVSGTPVTYVPSLYRGDKGEGDHPHLNPPPSPLDCSGIFDKGEEIIFERGGLFLSRRSLGEGGCPPAYVSRQWNSRAGVNPAPTEGLIVFFISIVLE